MLGNSKNMFLHWGDDSDVAANWQLVPPTFHAPAAWRGTLSTCRAAVCAGDDSSTGCLPTAAVCMRPSATCLLPPTFATPHWSVSTEHHTAGRQISKPQVKSSIECEDPFEAEDGLGLFELVTEELRRLESSAC